MDEVLIIIDMQAGFSPIPGDVTRAVVDEIRRFKACYLPIIVLEMDGMDNTISTISRAIGCYDLASYVTKYGMNGADLVIPTLTRLRTPFVRAARVCGLYTSLCVAATAEDLAESDKFLVTVVAKACFDDEDDHGSQLETWRMGLRSGVTVDARETPLLACEP